MKHKVEVISLFDRENYFYLFHQKGNPIFRNMTVYNDNYQNLRFNTEMRKVVGTQLTLTVVAVMTQTHTYSSEYKQEVQVSSIHELAILMKLQENPATLSRTDKCQFKIFIVITPIFTSLLVLIVKKCKY